MYEYPSQIDSDWGAGENYSKVHDKQNWAKEHDTEWKFHYPLTGKQQGLWKGNMEY